MRKKVQNKNPQSFTSETRKTMERKQPYLDNTVLVPDLDNSRDAQDEKRQPRSKNSNADTRYDRQGQLRLHTIERNIAECRVTPLLDETKQTMRNECRQLKRMNERTFQDAIRKEERNEWVNEWTTGVNIACKSARAQ